MVSGTIIDIGHTYSIKGVLYNTLEIEVNRTSKAKDNILIYVPLNGNIINSSGENKYSIGDYVTIKGQLRTSKKEKRCPNNKIAVLAEHMTIDAYKDEEDINDITLEGYVCKFPVHRYTPKGRIVSDIVLKVYRDKTKTSADYFPIVFWESCIEITKQLTVGSLINIEGRLQSRYYHNNKQNCKMVSYELSGYKITVMQDDTENGESLNDVG